MAETPRSHKTSSSKEQLGDEIGRRAERKRRAREQSARSAWFGLGMFGLVGWSVAIPILLGIVLGLRMHARWPGRVSWTLPLLIIGVALGSLNAWYWIQQENRRE
jgi:ATP synthase protein I